MARHWVSKVMLPKKMTCHLDLLSTLVEDMVIDNLDRTLSYYKGVGVVNWTPIFSEDLS